MAHGSPDYAAVAGELPAGKDYENYTLWASGGVGHGDSLAISFDAIPEGYEVYQAVGIASARGCDFCHAVALYTNDTMGRNNYFEVESAIFYPRHYWAKAGDVMTIEFSNYDAVDRFFAFSAIGIFLIVGTQPLNPQKKLGLPPKLKKNEKLWVVNDTLFGIHYVKARQRRIMEIPEAAFGYAQSIRSGGK